MAQRIYLPYTGATLGSFAASTAWEDTTSGMWVQAASLTKTSSALATHGISSTLTSGQDLLIAQFQLALTAGMVFSTSDTVKGQVQAKEATTADNIRSQCIIRVMTTGGTVRATLLAEDTAALTNEWFHTSLRNIQMPRGGAVPLQANYTVVAGDYLIIEMGARFGASVTPLLNMRFGDTGATDLPENETDTVTTKVPWIEFSGSFAAAPAGAVRTFIL